jgi:hypothetical protein
MLPLHHNLFTPYDRSLNPACCATVFGELVRSGRPDHLEKKNTEENTNDLSTQNWGCRYGLVVGNGVDGNGWSSDCISGASTNNRFFLGLNPPLTW